MGKKNENPGKIKIFFYKFKTKMLSPFNQRKFDWWILTLIPLLLIIILSIIILVKNGLIEALSIFVQQVLTFSFILSTTDFALRSFLDKTDPSSRLSPLLGIVIAFGTYVIYIFILDSEYYNLINVFIFTIITLVIFSLAVRLYYKNPNSNYIDVDPVKTKIEEQEKDDEKFEPN